MSRQVQGGVTFFDAYLAGRAVADEVDDFVEAWHENPRGQEIYEYLGLSREEYEQWVKDPDVLPRIAESRLASMTARKRRAAK